MSNYPSEWEEKSLGDFCECITKGTTPRQYTQKGINFIKVESVSLQGKLIESKFAKIPEHEHTNLRRSQLQKGDILFSIAGTLGRVATISENHLPANTNQALAIARLKGEELDLHYCLHFLSCQRVQSHLKSLQTIGAQPNLSLQQVSEISIPVPPLPEQKKIAEILSGIDAVINKMLEAIAKTETTLIGIFADLNLIASSGKTTLLGEAARVQNGYAFQSSTFSENSEDIPLIRISNISGGIVDASKSKRIPRNLAPSVEYQVNKGDVLIAMSGATTGKIGEYQGDDLCLLNQRVGKFIFHQGSESAFYASQLLLSGFLESRILAKAAGGAQPNISGKGIEEIEIPFPDAPDQLKYGNTIQKLLAMNSKRRFLVERYQQLKKALSSDLLSGRKRVSI